MKESARLVTSDTTNIRASLADNNNLYEYNIQNSNVANLATTGPITPDYIGGDFTVTWKASR